MMIGAASRRAAPIICHVQNWKHLMQFHEKKRDVFKDRQSRVQGYIEHQSDGSQHAMNAEFTIIAYYDKRKNVTEDPNHTKLNEGNTLVEIITGK